MNRTQQYRQIRASYDATTITVYQAYSEEIASKAVRKQKLDASPAFSVTRMTWVKPSWNWMMYRSGYSYKDERQARILAIKIKHEDFLGLLRKSVLTYKDDSDSRQKGPIATYREDEALRETRYERIDTGRKKHDADVKVQWDPERTTRLNKLPYRSIQIGIPQALVSQWVDDWIVGIEDVTERAKALRKALDEDAGLADETLISQGLMPEESVYEVPDDLRAMLEMDT